MTDRDDRAADSAVPGPRHAAPRVSTRSRLRGRALAIAAVPTALLMGTIPTLAMADTQKSTSCASAPDTVIEEIPVPKSDITPVPSPPAASVPGSSQTQTPTQVPKLPTQRPSAPASVPATTHPTASLPSIGVAPNVAGAPKAVAPAPAAPSASPSASASAAGVQSNGIIGDILDGILHPGGGSSPSPTPPAAPAPAPTQTPTQTSAPAPSTPEALPSAPAAPAAATTGTAKVPGGPASSAPSSAPTGGASTGSATATPKTATSPSPSASPSKNPNCLVDARTLTAHSEESGRVVPEQNWTLHSTRLGLQHAQFFGLVDVRTATTTKRVLKFVVQNVDIENLDMSTLEGNGVTFHVKSRPGSTSTMRSGPITMYVERLSGHLSKALGLPIPIDLGEITLTPTTLPQWLYDLIGAVPIPLDLEFTQVTAVQAGQFGGALTIPGMRMFNDNEPYPN